VPAIVVDDARSTLVEAPSTAGLGTVSPELVAEVSPAAIAAVDVAASVVVASEGSAALDEPPAAGAGAPCEAEPPPVVPPPSGAMTSGVDVSAVVVADNGTSTLVDVASSRVELPVEVELADEISGVGNVEVDTIGVVDADDVASEDDATTTRTGGVVVETGDDDATVSDEVAVSGAAFSGELAMTVDVGAVASGTLTTSVVLAASSVDVATCANTRDTIANNTKQTAEDPTTIEITITDILRLFIPCFYD
jgi:hypothetical protein